MVDYKLGEVYVVKFHPGSGSELKKYRPAVIVSQKVHDIDPRFVLICPLTTKNKENELELTLLKEPFLEKKSIFLGWYLWTVDTKRLTYKLGTLSEKNLSRILTLQKN